ncbi:MAG: hypothetical protein H0V61_04790 [Chitinophagales bacterium]|nr:hypothetical protein [Chitinophagales bacterium]
MKQIFILLLTIGFGKIFAQTYHPFPENEAVWHEEAWGIGCPVIPCEYDQYMYSGDTVINGYLYHKLYLSYKFLGQVTQSGYVGFIRQDSLAKKVYYITLGGPYENLLYDFNLQVGDFYPETYNHNSQDTFIISKVDSILLNGSYRKKYTLLPLLFQGILWQ